MTAASSSSCPTLLDELLACQAFVVEAYDILSDARHVVDGESDARNEFARMPVDLRDDAARL
jgi:hypothetical protein